MDTRWFRRLAATAVATVALAGVVTATVPAANDGARLRITASFDATLLGPDACGGFRVVASGTATGTHIGNGTWSQSECVVVVFDPVTMTVSVHVEGVGRITAANGDVLVVDYHADAAAPDPVTGEVHPRGTYDVDPAASTGRFAGSTGSGSVAVDGIANGHETAVFDGTIRPLIRTPRRRPSGRRRGAEPRAP